MGADSVTLRRKRAESSRLKSSWPESWQEMSTRPGIGKGLAQSDSGFCARLQRRDGARADGLSAGGPGEGGGFAFRPPVFLTVAVKATGWPTGATARAAANFSTARLETGPASAPARMARRRTGGLGALGEGKEGRPIRRWLGAPAAGLAVGDDGDEAGGFLAAGWPS